MWDEEDGFFYDVLQLPDGQAQRLKVRSMVGLLPLCAVTVFEGELREEVSGDHASGFARFLDARPELHQLHPRSGQGRACGPPARRRFSMKPNCAACWRRCSTKTNSSAPTASGRCRAIHAEHPYVIQRGRPGIPRRLRAGANPTPACSAATRTGAARSGCRSTR